MTLWQARVTSEFISWLSWSMVEPAASPSKSLTALCIIRAKGGGRRETLDFRLAICIGRLAMARCVCEGLLARIRLWVISLRLAIKRSMALRPGSPSTSW